MILSNSGQTHFSPGCFDSAEDAQRKPALAQRPAWRVGGISESRMPERDAAPGRLASPMYGQPGGGRECATSEPVYLFGIARLCGAGGVEERRTVMSWPEWKNRQTAELWKGALDVVRAEDTPDLEIPAQMARGGARWAAYRHGVRFSTGIVFRVAAWLPPGDRVWALESAASESLSS
jgi:hypothetical protein